MRAQHRAVAIVLAFAAGFAVPAAAQPSPPPGPIVWTPALPSNEGFAHLEAFRDGAMYAQSGQGYARSTDFGAHWTMQQGPDGQTGNSGMLEWSTPSRGFATVDRLTPTLRDPITGKLCPIGLPYFALDITLDGGTKWSPACAPVGPVTTRPLGFGVEGLYVSRRDSTVVVVGDSSPSVCRSAADIHPLLFISSDFGLHWRTIALPGGYTTNLLGYDVYDARHISALVSKATGTCDSYGSGPDKSSLFATTDGKHFKRVFQCSGSQTCASTAWVTPRRLLVGTTVGQLYVSNDQGKHFFKGALLRDADYDPATTTGVLDPRYFWVQSMSFADAQHGFASTRGSGTWRTTDGGLRWVQEKSPECVYYPFGIGDVAAADAEHGITGGPPTYDVRRPGTVELGCIGPQSGGPQVTPSRIIATESLPWASRVVRIDAIGRTSSLRLHR